MYGIKTSKTSLFYISIEFRVSKISKFGLIVLNFSEFPMTWNCKLEKYFENAYKKL